MITVDKKYLDKEKEIYPDMTVFAEKRRVLLQSVLYIALI